MSDRKEFHIKLHYYLALLIAFCLPIARLTPFFIALMLLNWIIEGDLRNKVRMVFRNKFALLFLSFFFLHLIGLAYTSNMEAGLFDIQVKLSLFVFPLILASRPLGNFQVRNIFMSFIAGGIISSLIMLSRAMYTYFAYEEFNFFYQAFSFLIHPSYLSLYFDLCIAWLLYNMLRRDVSNGISRIVSLSVIAFLSFIIVLLSSKMGLLTLFLIFFAAVIGFIITRKRYLAGLGGLLLIGALVFFMVRFVPEIRDRFNNAIAALNAPGTDQSQTESTAVRLLIWKAADHVISSNFLLGTGTGDAKDELMLEYEARGMTGALEHKLNAHNEFYQVFVSIGLLGFVVFVAGLLLPLFAAWKKGNTMYVVFLLLMILNFIPESMLETQAGVMFFAFFNSLLCFQKNTVNEH